MKVYYRDEIGGVCIDSVSDISFCGGMAYITTPEDDYKVPMERLVSVEEE